MPFLSHFPFCPGRGFRFWGCVTLRYIVLHRIVCAWCNAYEVFVRSVTRVCFPCGFPPYFWRPVVPASASALCTLLFALCALCSVLLPIYTHFSAIYGEGELLCGRSVQGDDFSVPSRKKEGERREAHDFPLGSFIERLGGNGTDSALCSLPRASGDVRAV